MACQARRARCIATASAQVGSARTRGHGGRASDRVSLHASAVHSSAGGRNWRAQKLVMGSMPCYRGGASRRAVEAHMYGAHLDLFIHLLELTVRCFGFLGASGPPHADSRLGVCRSVRVIRGSYMIQT